MSKECIYINCKKEIPDDSLFCGFCGTKQEDQKDRTTEQVKQTSKDETGPKVISEKDKSKVFYADDYEVVRQFDPVIMPTKDKVSFENLLTAFQETVRNKNYPFTVQGVEQRWRTESGKGKQRIVIQPAHDNKWQKILFPIAVEQLGNDTTIKLSTLRKNEMAEFYYSVLDSISIFSSAWIADSKTELSYIHEFGRLDKDELLKYVYKQLVSLGLLKEAKGLYDKFSEDGNKDELLLHLDLIVKYYFLNHKINWQDKNKYRPIVDQAIHGFSIMVESIIARFKPDEINEAKDINNPLKTFIHSFFEDFPEYRTYYQEIHELVTLRNLTSIEINDMKSSQEKILSSRKQECKKIENDIIYSKNRVKSLSKSVWIISGIIFFASLVFLHELTPFIILWVIIWAAFLSKKIEKDSEKRRQSEVQNIKNEKSQLIAELSQNLNKKQSTIYEMDHRIIEKYNKIINKVSERNSNIFHIAEQNEIRWRMPSFVDEELEQLISVVKNLFNQIVGKLSAKKETRDVKLQSTMGLGGMGFEE